MNDEEKLLWMFTEVHGPITGSCYTEIDNDEYTGDPIGISVMKDGDLCWHRTKLDIVFEYLTRHLQ
jgi:hypothetical protein